MTSPIPRNLDIGPLRRWTVEDLERLIRAGAFADDDVDCELIDGALIDKPPIGEAHSSLSDILASRLRAAYAGRAFVRCANPIVTGHWSQPQPDLSIVPGSPEAFRGKIPTGAETWLVIEIAASTIRRDRAKAVVYGQGQVPAYWIVDLDRRVVEAHVGPTVVGYERVKVYAPGERIELPELGVSWDVGEFLL